MHVKPPECAKKSATHAQWHNEKAPVNGFRTQFAIVVIDAAGVVGYRANDEGTRDGAGEIHDNGMMRRILQSMSDPVASGHFERIGHAFHGRRIACLRLTFTKVGASVAFSFERHALHRLSVAITVLAFERRGTS